MQDTGIGIPVDQLPYLFDRFYQVDDELTHRAEDTGIGLPRTKDLVKLLDGKISVKELATEVHMSRLQLDRKLSALTGYSASHISDIFV